MSIKANYPDVRPTLNLDFANTKRLDPRISFTRASTGTYVDADGLIKTAAVNAPRFDHDPATNESLGLLIEESRTNLVLSSEEFSGFGWVADTIITRTLNYATSPDGQTTAERVENDGSGGPTNGYVQVSSSISGGTASKTFTFSLYVKSNSGTQTFRLKNTHGNVIDNFSSNFTATSEWQRFELTVTNSASAGNGTQIVGIIADTSGNAYDVSVFGAQLEEGSFPTSYIPTSGSTVTRSADFGTIEVSEFNYSSVEATLFVDTITPPDVTTNQQFLIASSHGSARWLYSNTTTAHFQAFDGTSTAQSDNLSVNTRVKLALAVNESSKQVFNNGVAKSLISGASAINIISLTTEFRLGRGHSDSGFYNGHIKQLQYYPVRLSNTVLQGMTT